MPEQSPDGSRQLTPDELIAAFDITAQALMDGLPELEALVQNYRADLATFVLQTPHESTPSPATPSSSSSNDRPRTILPLPKTSLKTTSTSSQSAESRKHGQGTNAVNEVDASRAVQGGPIRAGFGGGGGGEAGGQKRGGEGLESVGVAQVVVEGAGVQSTEINEEKDKESHKGVPLGQGSNAQVTPPFDQPNAPYEVKPIPILQQLRKEDNTHWYNKARPEAPTPPLSPPPAPLDHAASRDLPIKDVLLTLKVFEDPFRRSHIDVVVAEFEAAGLSPKVIWRNGEEDSKLITGSNGLAMCLIREVVLAVGASEGWTEERMFEEELIGDDFFPPPDGFTLRIRWTKDEDEALKEAVDAMLLAVKKSGSAADVSWRSVLLELQKKDVLITPKTAVACSKRAILLGFYKSLGRWTKEEDAELKRIYDAWCKKNPKLRKVAWEPIAAELEATEVSELPRNATACKDRALRLKWHVPIKHWQKEEDNVLRARFKIESRRHQSQGAEFRWGWIADEIKDAKVSPVGSERNEISCQKRAKKLKLEDEDGEDEVDKDEEEGVEEATG